jgi:outer membrane protein OmpA-like peptidoglycan-associated protein
LPSSRRFFRSALLSTGALLAGTAIVLPGVAQAAPATDTAPTAATATGPRLAAAPSGFFPMLTPYGQEGQYRTTETSLAWIQPDDGADYRCQLDGSEWASCLGSNDEEPGYEMWGLEFGEHTLHVQRSVDGGDVWQEHQTTTFLVQIEAVEVDDTLVDGPDTRRSFTVGGYRGDDKFVVECSVDGADFTPCPDNGRFDLEGLAQGTHTFETRQYVAADRNLPGRTSETTKVTFDVTPPIAPIIVEGPSGTVDTTFASFRLSYENFDTVVGDIECSLDGADFAPCYDSLYFRELSQGEHVFRARGNVDGINPSAVVERRWIVNGFVSDEPTGPQFGDAPAPAPAPTPTPTPATAPTPAPELKAPTAPLAGKTAAVVGRALTVGCTVPGATSYRCEVSVTKGGKTLGRAVRTGNGSVQIKLTRAGARQVQRSGKGLTVKVQVKATVDGRTTVTTKTVRLLPTKDLALSTDEFFGAKGAKPTAAAKRIAKDIAAQLSGARRITITGHTDNAGSTAANERLGLERAQAISALLRSAGLGGAKVVVDSAGETKPKASNGTAKGREQNRRVEIAVSY